MKAALRLMMMAGLAASIYGVYQMSPAWGWAYGGFVVFAIGANLYDSAKKREPEAHTREADRLVREVQRSAQRSDRVGGIGSGVG